MQNPTSKQYHHLFPPQMSTRPWVIRCHNLTLSNKNSSTFTAPSSLPLSRFILLPHSTDFRAHAFLHSLKSTAACKISTNIWSGISYSQRKWCSLVEITCKELSTNMVSVQMNKGGMTQDPKKKIQFPLVADHSIPEHHAVKVQMILQGVSSEVCHSSN